MTEARAWLSGLVTLAVGLVAACDDQEDPSGQGGWQPPVTATGGGTTGGGTSPPGSVLPGTRDGGPIFPGPMSMPPDGSVFGPADASVPGDAASPTTSDGSAPARPDGGATDLASCMPPPADSSATAVRAWTILNEIRLAAGAGCMNMVAALNTAAQSHCNYRAMNRSNPACAADAHSEISGCPGFTGTDVQAREIAAGYPRQLAYTEVALTYGDNPERAIPGWLVTPYHRVPLIDPWTTDMGWGGAPGCDVIDMGRGTARPPENTIVVYPHDGATDVPTSFNGLEAPQPPPPASGWPSSYPVSIYAQRIMVTEHVLTEDGDPTPLDHVFLDTRNPGAASVRAYFPNTAILYGAAFQPNTKYRVKIVGSYAGGALNAEWTFTTGAARPSFF